MNIQKEFRCDFKLNIFIFLMIYWKPTNLFKQKRMTCLKLDLKSASKVRKQKKKNYFLKSYGFHLLQKIINVIRNLYGNF